MNIMHKGSFGKKTNQMEYVPLPSKSWISNIFVSEGLQITELFKSVFRNW